MFEKRFQPKDEGNGSWSVIDGESGLPAVVRQRTLAGLSEEDASDATDLMNLVAMLREERPRPAVVARTGLQPFLLPVR